jgi:hypothetical protein
MAPGARAAYRRGRFDLASYRSRVRARLTTRFGLRLHMTLLVALVFATAFLVSRLMLAAGVRSMGARYLCASAVGYLAFFGLLRAWLWYVTADPDPHLHPDAAPDSVARAIDPDAPPRAVSKLVVEQKERGSYDAADIGPDLPSLGGSGSSGGGSGGGGGGGGFDLDLGDGIVAVLIVILVAVVAAVVLGAAGYMVYQAPSVLGEAVVEVILASVLARSSRKVTTEGWSGTVLGASWKPALIMTTMVTLGGFAAQGLCPEEATLRGVIRTCVLESGKKG